MNNVIVLNVGAGDTKLTFDPKKPAERKHAARVITDMLKRGYAILVEVGEDKDGEPLYRRAKAFDAKTCEYIIVGLPEDAAAEAPAKVPPRRAAKKPPRKAGRVKAEGRRAVAVAPTAGG